MERSRAAEMGALRCKDILKLSSSPFLLSNSFLDIREASNSKKLTVGRNHYLAGSIYETRLTDAIGIGLIEFLNVSDGFLLVVSEMSLKEDIEYSFKGEDWVRFFYTLGGKQEVTLNGELHMNEGDHAHLALHPIGSIISDKLYAGEEIARRVTILVKREKLLEFIGVSEKNLSNEMAKFFFGSEKWIYNAEFRLAGKALALLQKFFDKTIPVLFRPLHLKAATLELVTLHLFEILEGMIERDDAIKIYASAKKQLLQAKEILEEDLLITKSLPEVAKIVGLNRSKLSQGFHHMFGVTIQQYIMSLKMERAQNYLQNREGSVSELAWLLGYSHVGNLSAAVKKYFGCPPRDLI
ncbi:MAG: helix-turn-helix transcriptional regulator [Kordiimonadaceae bacterium]|nr:helix-turn-helix transcriptional regulator [Kordiimonadaceae bacterium]